jgi:hypothetical protein
VRRIVGTLGEDIEAMPPKLVQELSPPGFIRLMQSINENFGQVRQSLNLELSIA